MSLEIALLALGLPICITLLLPDCNTRRCALVAVVLLFTGRYVMWRCTSFPYTEFWQSAGGWWMAAVLVVEMLAILEYLQFLVTITWLTDRREQADNKEAALRQQYRSSGADTLPSIDILIPTYNEDVDVVGKTILAASQIDYPKAQVYVLDDGNRPWLSEYCNTAGVHYITRSDRQGAKAGNINHALQLISGDLCLVLDADFVPYRNCLWRLAGFFDDETVATVQTPQSFYNPDAIQHNLNISSSWGCEQEFFFQIIMPGRDSLGAAFCCGSCCLHRTSALRDVGGFPTSSITEDILLTIKLVQRGWKTLYLREAVTCGLAAETMESFFVQRKRWGRGNIQVGYQIATESGLHFREKLLFFPFYWMIQHGSRIFFQLIPIVFFLTGTGPIPAIDGQETIDFQLPFVLAVSCCMLILMRPYYMPLFSESMSLFSAFALLPEMLQSLARPYSKGFLVTPKGRESLHLRRSIYRDTLIPSIALLAINILVLAQVLLGLSSASISVEGGLALYALIWCSVNTVLLIICVLMSLERPEPRQEHRLWINQPASLRAVTASGIDSSDTSPSSPISIDGLLADLSMSGGRMLVDGHGIESVNTAALQSEPLSLQLRTGAVLPLEHIWMNRKRELVFTFTALPMELEKQLVGYAFSGAFTPAEQPQRVRVLDTLKQLIRDCLG